MRDAGRGEEPSQPTFDGPGDGSPWPAALGGLAAVLAVGLRLVRLHELPGESYGDVAIVREYVDDVRAWRWPTHFVLSTGPLYHYLAAPLTLVTGPSFDGLKAISVLVSAWALVATALFARELAGRWLAAASLFVAGVSAWLLVFSRLGNSQILTAALSTTSLWLAVRVVRRHRVGDAVACGLVAALGAYCYPQTFVLGAVVVLTLAALVVTGAGATWRDVRTVALAVAAGMVPFLLLLLQDPGQFVDGYIGDKAGSFSVGELARNLWRTVGAFNLRGDEVFRSNPPHAPHLDVVSGVLMLVGFGVWMRPGWRRWAPAIVVPWVLLQLPSALVLARPREVPSASRTLAVAPLTYVLVATGLLWAAQRLARTRVEAGALVAAVLLVVAGLNEERYFGTYADGLPNGNVAFGRTIADDLATRPDGTHAYIVGCCWGDWGQPEPKAIVYLDAGDVPDGLVELPRDGFGCASIADLPRPAVLVWNPGDAALTAAIAACPGVTAPRTVRVRGLDVFDSSDVE